MAAYISPNDYRVTGEKAALYCGFGILAILIIILYLTKAVNFGGVALFLVSYTAILVWIQQGQLIGGAAKVSKKQFPEIYAIATEAATRLGMMQPEIFIRQDPTLNAFAMGFLGKKSVVLHSATVEAMEHNELEHIIGHEFSHIKCSHTNLIVLTSSSNCISVPIISQIMSFIFLFWSRKAEYTCDRGGLLASRDSKAAIAAMCKLAVGPTLFKQMDIEDFQNQQMAIDQDDISKISENLANHPYLVKRIRAIQHYFESEEFKQLSGRNNRAPQSSRPD